MAILPLSTSSSLPEAPRIATPRLRALEIWLWYFLSCIVSIPVLRFVSIPNVPVLHQTLAIVLLFICTLPSIIQLTQKEKTFPVFPIICLVYAVAYALPVFHSIPIVASAQRAGFRVVQTNDVTAALQLSILGVLSMQFGFAFFKFSILHLIVPRIQLPLRQERAQRIVTVLGAIGILLLWLGLTGRINVPERFFSLFIVLANQASLCMALLYLYWINGKLQFKGKWILFLVLIGWEVIAFASGALRTIMNPMLIMMSVYWMQKKKIPWKFILAALLVFLIMQPIKASYRYMTMEEGYGGGSVVEKVKLWFILAEDSVLNILESEKRNKLASQSARSALGRTDFIHMFAHIHYMTPKLVPYQNGSTYTYLLLAIIPRALWPDKPSAQTANEYFGVAYGFQTEESLLETSIGAPHLIESYVNFGVLGVIFVMMIIGMIYATVDRMFNHPFSAEGGMAIYAVMLPSLLTIETAAAPTFGALFQTIFIYILTLRMARQRKGITT